MPTPVLNGVLKPADQIARGPHVFNEATRKYEERPQTFSEYPRAMWNHEMRIQKDAISRQDQQAMESQGWSTKPFPEVMAKETVTAAPADLALIVLQQQQTMTAMQKQLETLQATQPTTTPAIPEEAPKRGPGRPAKVHPEEA